MVIIFWLIIIHSIHKYTLIIFDSDLEAQFLHDHCIAFFGEGKETILVKHNRSSTAWIVWPENDLRLCGNVSAMALPVCGFAVYSDKTGQLPLAIERRAKGKRVTIITGVKGNARALCQSLTSLLGVGGTVHSKGQFFDVEVQGEQTERVSSALRQLACVRGPGGVKLKEAAVVERTCGYDDFLQQELRREGKERWGAGRAGRAGQGVALCCIVEVLKALFWSSSFWHHLHSSLMVDIGWLCKY